MKDVNQFAIFDMDSIKGNVYMKQNISVFGMGFVKFKWDNNFFSLPIALI